MTNDEAITELRASIKGIREGDTFQCHLLTYEIALDCMERCKQIDEAEYKKVMHESPTDTVCNGCNWEIGWNDCLRWAKGKNV